MYDSIYYDTYKKKNLFGFEKGERPFLYAFWIRKLKKLLPPDALVLEVGCGGGYFLKRLEQQFQVIGMDISEEALKITRSKVKSPLYRASADKLPFEKESFAGVIAFDVIEHLEKPEALVTEVSRVLKKNGIFIFTTPNPFSLGARIKGATPRQTGLPPEQRLTEWQGWRDDTHINIKPVESWRDLIKNNDFEIIRDGTDTLWDIPYTNKVPFIIQKLFFISMHWILTWLFGFFSWKYGENYICIARKL